MPGQSNENRIKRAVENKLVDLLKKNGKKPEKEDLQVLGLSVKYLAVAAKLDESAWGSDLDKLDEGGEMDDDAETDS